MPTAPKKHSSLHDDDDDLLEFIQQSQSTAGQSTMKQVAGGVAAASLVRVPPHHYIHVLDSNTNVVRVIAGPFAFTREAHETVVFGPSAMLSIPTRHYVVIGNPAVRDAATGEPLKDKHGIVRVAHGEREIRLSAQWPEPFPLQPGEKASRVRKLLTVKKNNALKLRASRDFDDKRAGDEFLFRGPGTYVPRVEVDVVETQEAIIVKSNTALRLRAKRGTVSQPGDVARRAGEEWLMRETGAYMLSVDEELVEVVEAVVLTERRAVHLTAERSFTDVYGVARKAGQEWLVTLDLASTHLPDVHETVVDMDVGLVSLSSREWCVVLDPVGEDGVQRLGTRELRTGTDKGGDARSFFLHPGESLENGVCAVHVLADDQALLLKSTEEFVEEITAEQARRQAAAENGAEDDGTQLVGGDDDADSGVKIASPARETAAPDSDNTVKIVRKPGDIWMRYGPCEYVPPVSVTVVDKRVSMPLDENEGVYVRNVLTGQVRAVVGKTYMLKAREELWQKEMPGEVEVLLQKQKLGQAFVDLKQRATRRGQQGGLDIDFETDVADESSAPQRDAARVVTFRVPHNAACQVYDFKTKTSRVVFGPELVLLQPDEQFTVVKLSGDKPKRPNVIKTLCLMLGPDFMTDIITVETSDHARLSLTLAYNWHFETGDRGREAGDRIFNVRDFTGDACKAVASRVRGAVASETFDNFHKNSAKIIRTSVFGTDKDTGKIRDELKFRANGLVITNVDIQSVEPVDASTRASLQKSVQLAIEITTQSTEAAARHEARREEEAAKGRLEQQQLQNQCSTEQEKKRVLQLQAECAAVESSGQATAEAKARAEAATIQAEAAVKQAELRARARQIEQEAELAHAKAVMENEVAKQRALNELEAAHAQKMADIETARFQAQVAAIGGGQTIAEIARAGPEMQAKLLGGLGLSTTLITDGKSPINLFQTAEGMIAGSIKK